MLLTTSMTIGSGAYHYHFDPKTGYTACEFDKFFPIVEEVTVTL